MDCGIASLVTAARLEQASAKISRPGAIRVSVRVWVRVRVRVRVWVRVSLVVGARG
jgi:hypothetical protein